MQERRKFKRRYLMYYSRVFNRQTGELLGYLVDITPAGAMIISEQPIETGTLFRLRMDLPDDVSTKTRLDFDARSVWCKPDVNPDFYDTGFELIDLPQKDATIIERMIEDYGFRD